MCPAMLLVMSLGGQAAAEQGKGWMMLLLGWSLPQGQKLQPLLQQEQQCPSSSLTYTLHPLLHVAVGLCPALWGKGLILATLLLLLFLLTFVMCGFSS